jgi:NAD dependent epimerase/dehydratase family enzyme
LMGEMAEVLFASQRVIPQVALETGYRFRFADLRAALEHLLDQRRRQAGAPESARAGSGR